MNKKSKAVDTPKSKSVATKKILLKVENLVAGYGQLTVLHNVSIELCEDEIVSLIGPNGAGKSTLIRAIFALADVSSGSISCRNNNGEFESILALPPYKMLSKDLGYVNQGRVIFSTLTVEENLDLAASIVCENDEEIEREKQNVFNLFPMLKQKRSSVAYALSGGQQQQLALARVMVQSPKILLLDEPTLGLNPTLQEDLFEKIELLKDSMGVCVLMVEQNAKRAIEISNRTYLLKNGEIALAGGREILKNPMIKKVYLGG